MIRFRPLLVMTLFSVAALVVLVALGRWQWERYQQALATLHEPLSHYTLIDYRPAPEKLQFVFGVRPDTHEEGWRVFAPVQDGANRRRRHGASWARSRACSSSPCWPPTPWPPSSSCSSRFPRR